MTNLNVYLTSCSSSVNCPLGCGTLGYLVLTAQPAVFSTHCATAFVAPTCPGVHPTIPTPAPTAAALAEIFRNHKHDLKVFFEYHAVDKACKKVVMKLIPEKFYKSLPSSIIGFSSKVLTKR